MSAINFFEGGPLSVLKDCLLSLNNSKYATEFRILALVHKIELFNLADYPRVQFVEFSKGRNSYFHRLYYEYIYFKKLALNEKVSFWFSLHDITPNVGNIPQAVYCHNPSPFNTVNISDIYVQPTQFFFRLFYKYLYQINIKKNKFVVVQQMWMKNKFAELFELPNNKIIVALPKIPQISVEYIEEQKSDEISFLFPTYPRPFKNIEVICQAVQILNNEGIKNFSVKVTIDGSENKYSALIVKQYRGLNNLNFVGLLDRNSVYSQYGKTHCLIFPSKLETWGLPISEFKQYYKPMIIADLPYAKETVGSYEEVAFFKPDSAIQLASYMKQVIDGKAFEKRRAYNQIYEYPFAEGWEDLFDLLISK